MGAPALTDLERVWLAELLNRLPFVEWDRMSLGRGKRNEMMAFLYGWIARPDGRSDFVVVFVDHDGLGFTTSSAARSDEIAGLLDLGGDHLPCKRIEDELPGVEHAARA